MLVSDRRNEKLRRARITQTTFWKDLHFSFWAACPHRSAGDLAHCTVATTFVMSVDHPYHPLTGASQILCLILILNGKRKETRQHVIRAFNLLRHGLQVECVELRLKRFVVVWRLHNRGSDPPLRQWSWHSPDATPSVDNDFRIQQRHGKW